MTNIDRVADIVWGITSDAYLVGPIAKALADATPPLLMPDLPEPQVVPTCMEDRVYLSWRGDPVDVEQSARITELFIPGESFPILSLNAGEARNLALTLLAASNYAERNQK